MYCPFKNFSILLFIPTCACALAVKEQPNSDVERDTTRIACLPPAKVQLPYDSAVIQIACGLHHTVLLLQNGQVNLIQYKVFGLFLIVVLLRRCTALDQISMGS